MGINIVFLFGMYMMTVYYNIKPYINGKNLAAVGTVLVDIGYVVNKNIYSGIYGYSPFNGSLERD